MEEEEETIDAEPNTEKKKLRNHATTEKNKVQKAAKRSNQGEREKRFFS